MTKRFLFIFACLFLTTCSFDRVGNARVSFKIDGELRGPVANYRCFGVLVTGPKIPSLDPADVVGTPQTHCSYPGIGSKFIDRKNTPGDVEIDIEVPRGEKRLIQVLALELGSASACPSSTISEFFLASRKGESGTAPFGGMYEVGSTVMDVTSSARVEIPDTFNVNKNLRACSGTFSADELMLKPLAPTNPLFIGTNQHIKFTAEGGTPPYTFSTAGTFGTIDAGTGAYVATSIADQTVKVRVTDSLGQMKQIYLITMDFPTAYAWYSGDQFWDQADGLDLSGASWTNRAAAASHPGSMTGNASGGTLTLVKDGPNGFPAVHFTGGARFEVGGLPSFTFNGGDAYVVLRRNTSSGGSRVFCLTSGSNCNGTENFMTMFFSINWSASFGVTGIGALSISHNQIPPSYFMLRGEFKYTAGDGKFHSKVQVNTFGTATQDTSNRSYDVSDDTLFIGTNPAQTFDGDIAEVLIFPQEPSSPVQAYLQNKYNL